MDTKCMPSCACTYVYTYKCVLAKQPNKTSLFTHILEELIYIYIYIYIYNVKIGSSTSSEAKGKQSELPHCSR